MTTFLRFFSVLGSWVLTIKFHYDHSCFDDKQTHQYQAYHAFVPISIQLFSLFQTLIIVLHQTWSTSSWKLVKMDENWHQLPGALIALSNTSWHTCYEVFSKKQFKHSSAHWQQHQRNLHTSKILLSFWHLVLCRWKLLQTTSSTEIMADGIGLESYFPLCSNLRECMWLLRIILKSFP